MRTSACPRTLRADSRSIGCRDAGIDGVLDGLTCEHRELLTWSIMAASVVLFPLPVVPVTRTSRAPRRRYWEGWREQEVADRQESRRDDAKDEPHGAALLKDIAAEAAEAGTLYARSTSVTC